MMPPYKNSEYYTDWTAYKAIQNIERKKSTMLIAPVKNPLPGQVYETTSTNGNTFTVLVLAASQDDTVSTTRVYDQPRLINSQNIRVNNRMMYVDPSKMGFAQNANLTGLIGTLPPEDMIKVRRAMVSIYNLGTAAADVPAIPDAPAPVVEKPVDKVENNDKTRINALERELGETKAQAEQYKQESDEYAEKIEFANADRDIAKEMLKKAQEELDSLNKEIAAITAESATYSKLLHELLDKLMQK